MKFPTVILSLTPVALGNVVQSPLQPDPSSHRYDSLNAIPHLGFGTWNLKEGNTSSAVSWAIQVGYRHIDAAAIYGNEFEVGLGIADGLRQTGLKREDLWITSKLWNDHHDANLVQSALKTTLENLGVDYLDLYLMHWPVADGYFGGHSIDFRDTWAAMTMLRAEGKVRHLGVANFSPEQIQTLLNHTRVRPAVHQMESHPYLQQQDFIDWHEQNQIHVTAYSPLGGTNPTYDQDKGPEPLLNNSAVLSIARKRTCTPAQVVLEWNIARGLSVIPKSIRSDHILENFNGRNCTLKHKDLKKITALGKHRHRYNNPSKGWGVELFHGLEDFDGKHKKGTFKFH